MSFGFRTWKEATLRHPSLPGHPSREEPVPPRPPGQRSWLTAAVAALIAVAVLLLLVLFLPRYLLSWDLAGSPARPADQAGAVNAIRSALMQGLAGLVVLAGAVFTWRQLQVSRQGQVTDRYTRAIEQLGKDSPVRRAVSREEVRTQRAGTGSDNGRHSRLISP